MHSGNRMKLNRIILLIEVMVCMNHSVLDLLYVQKLNYNRITRIIPETKHAEQMSNKIEIFRGFASSNFSCALEVEV